MKTLSTLFLCLLFIACDQSVDNSGAQTENELNDTISLADDTDKEIEGPEPVKETPDPTPVEEPAKEKPQPPATSKTYANKVFKDVKVTKTGPSSYRVTGRAQVFEASFSYVIEDGHNQLLKGHDMTDAGAPEWGNFDFTFTLVEKPRVGSTPHLILLVYSAKDGSPTHELPIPLPGEATV